MPQANRPTWWPSESSFRRRLAGGPPPNALFATLGSVNVVELVSVHRPDALILDLEHTTGSLDTVRTMVLAAQSAGVSALVRVPHSDSRSVGRLLDAGADGIVFPGISTVDQARQAARSVRYPPAGDRGWAGAHARRSRWSSGQVVGDDGAVHGLMSHEFVQAADRALTTIFMIEDPAGVASIDAILDIGTPDAVLFGRGDFSVQVGFDATVVEAAYTAVYDACRGRGIGLALGTTARDASLYYPGCFLMAGVESAVFSDAMAKHLRACREFSLALVPSPEPDAGAVVEP